MTPDPFAPAAGPREHFCERCGVTAPYGLRDRWYCKPHLPQEWHDIQARLAVRLFVSPTDPKPAPLELDLSF